MYECVCIYMYKYISLSHISLISHAWYDSFIPAIPLIQTKCALLTRPIQIRHDSFTWQMIDSYDKRLILTKYNWLTSTQIHVRPAIPGNSTREILRYFPTHCSTGPSVSMWWKRTSNASPVYTCVYICVYSYI